tara:strand:- start:269 stop:424 length:156 start_codon:yes stop_codon:yes gene_type:complete
MPGGNKVGMKTQPGSKLIMTYGKGGMVNKRNKKVMYGKGGMVKGACKGMKK